MASGEAALVRNTLYFRYISKTKTPGTVQTGMGSRAYLQSYSLMHSGRHSIAIAH